jgi:hypothetical protein
MDQWEGLSHILWKIKFMFETTNQPMKLDDLGILLFQETLMFFVFFDDTVDEPAKSESPVENGGKHPIVYRLSTISRGAAFATIHSSSPMLALKNGSLFDI